MTPSALQPLGDTQRPIALVAPAGAVNPAHLEATCQLLSTLGYRFHLATHAGARHRYLAGTVAQRLEDLYEAFNVADVAAVWCLRGGYGCAQLMERIDWQRLPDVPLLGYSDISVLLSAFHARGRQAIHAPVATELLKAVGDQDTSPVDNRQRQASVNTIAPVLAGQAGEMAAVHVAGPKSPIEGVLIGGNLTTLASLAGTQAALYVSEQAILMLEDVGERLYRLERSLCQLLESVDLTRIRAVCLGSFTHCESPDGDTTFEQVLAEWLAPHNIALYHQLPFGHGAENQAWPVGRWARLASNTLRWESAHDHQ